MLLSVLRFVEFAVGDYRRDLRAAGRGGVGGTARTELDMVGSRRRAPDELTATELRVAALAAAGITNREIARAVFMSEKTVEAHIARPPHSASTYGPNLARTAGNPASSQRNLSATIMPSDESFFCLIEASEEVVSDVYGQRTFRPNGSQPRWSSDTVSPGES